jgi:hypothetical protein
MSTQQHPRYQRRTIGWGEALILEIHFSPGLSPLVRTINSAAGDQGVRNTFARLYDYEEPPTSDDPRDYFRAWLVLTALGQDPAAWGIGDDAVADGYDLDKLRELVTAASGWLGVTAALAAAS